MSGRGAMLPAVALWLGVLSGRAMAIERSDLALAVALIAALAATVAAAAAWRCDRRAAWMLIGCAAFTVGAARGATLAAGLAADRSRMSDAALHRLVAVVEEPVTGPPDQMRAVLRVERAEPPLARGARLRVRLPEAPGLEWGDRVQGLVELVAPPPLRNPGGWDARAGADAAALAGSGRAVTLTRVGSTATGAIARGTGVRWRRAIERLLHDHLSPPARDLVVPLVTGDRSEFPAELDADFRASGLVHLLALSGLHVSALAAVARSVAASAGGGVGVRALAGVLAALFYVGLAGPLPSLARAAVTECWTAAARVARRPVDPVQALAVTTVLLLALAPGWALDLGFQLSCAASLGLACAASWSEAVPRRARAALGPLLASLAAQALCAPILIDRVHGFAWPAPAANLIAVPMCGMLLAAAWIAVGAEAIAPGSGRVFFAACEALARGLAWITHQAASWPAALVATGHEPGVTALAGVGALLLALGLAAPRDLEGRAQGSSPVREATLGGGLLASVLAVALAASAPELRPRAGVTWVVALDVGQGDATAIGTARAWWLVDAGPRNESYDAGERVVNPFLRWAAVRGLEALVLTHEDADHTGGAAAVRRRVAVRRLLAPVTSAPSPGLRRVAAGETLAGEPLAIVRWPPREANPVRDRSDNAGALVIELIQGPVRAWLPADVDSVVERELEAAGPVELLKVGHHGSASSSGTDWLARTRPRVAWISAGAHNVYGHPSPKLLERLRRTGTRIDRTDREGALWYELGPRGVRRLDWRSAARPEVECSGLAPGPVLAPRLP